MYEITPGPVRGSDPTFEGTPVPETEGVEP